MMSGFGGSRSSFFFRCFFFLGAWSARRSASYRRMERGRGAHASAAQWPFDDCTPFSEFELLWSSPSVGGSSGCVERLLEREMRPSRIVVSPQPGDETTAPAEQQPAVALHQSEAQKMTTESDPPLQGRRGSYLGGSMGGSLARPGLSWFDGDDEAPDAFYTYAILLELVKPWQLGACVVLSVIRVGTGPRPSRRHRVRHRGLFAWLWSSAMQWSCTASTRMWKEDVHLRAFQPGTRSLLRDQLWLFRPAQVSYSS